MGRSNADWLKGLLEQQRKREQRLRKIGRRAEIVKRFAASVYSVAEDKLKGQQLTDQFIHIFLTLPPDGNTQVQHVDDSLPKGRRTTTPTPLGWVVNSIS